VGQDIDAFEHLAASGVGEEQLLCHGSGVLMFGKQSALSGQRSAEQIPADR
jgi:hypothetical protein